MRKLSHSDLCDEENLCNSVAYQKISSLSPSLNLIYKEVQKELAVCYEDQSLNQEDTEELIYSVAERLGYTINSSEKDNILAYVEKDYKPFGLLQDLVDDKSINDIIISAHNHVVIQKGRKNYKTEFSFTSKSEYENFVEKILTKIGTTYSTKMPITDGMYGSWIRIHAVHSTLCEDGPYLTIRLNRLSNVFIKDLLEYGLAPKPILDYLSNAIFLGHTILIAGEVGTGKTTLTRALAACIPPEESILVIEDTPEIQLAHPTVRYLRTRGINTEGAGKIAPSECIRAGMRMAMNRIIFGEIRDGEAAESFVDVCSSGHPGISTIHARSSQDTIARLELFLGRAQKGASREVINRQIANAVQFVVHIDICRETGQRRIFEVKEIGEYADNTIRQSTIFEYKVKNSMPIWLVKNRFSQHLNLSNQTCFSELPNEIRLYDDTNILEVV